MPFLMHPEQVAFGKGWKESRSEGFLEGIERRVELRFGLDGLALLVLEVITWLLDDLLDEVGSCRGTLVRPTTSPVPAGPGKEDREPEVVGGS